MSAPGVILIVDDEPGLADTLAMIFQRAGYSAEAAYSGEGAMAWMKRHPASLVITDVIMPGMDGIKLAKLVRETWPDCQVILFSGNADTQGMLEAAKEEGLTFEVIAKPVPPMQLLSKVAALLHP